jgi:hypothetical protein
MIARSWRHHRVVTRMLMILALAAGLVFAAAPPTHASDPGYTLINPMTTGIDPLGVNVRVVASSGARTTLARDVPTVVSDMRRAGLDVRWVGYQANATTGISIMLAGGSACPSGRLGTTYPRFAFAYNGRLVQTGGLVQICPAALGTPWLLMETLRHEMGHAVGLAHTNSRLGGRLQTMTPMASSAIVAYGPGDWNGLREIARRTAAAKLMWPAVGRIDATKRLGSSTQIAISGWAVSPVRPTARQTIWISVNGTYRYVGVTAVGRPDVNHTYDRTTATPHGYSATINGVRGFNRVCVIARTTISAAKTLGCFTAYMA